MLIVDLEKMISVWKKENGKRPGVYDSYGDVHGHRTGELVLGWRSDDGPDPHFESTDDPDEAADLLGIGHYGYFAWYPYYSGFQPKATLVMFDTEEDRREWLEENS